MKPWKRIDPTIITKVGHRTIIGKTFVMPDKSIAEFETYDREGRQYVAVIALTPNNLVVTARQFRAGPEKLMYELPGGGVEANESLESAIHRELLEETGYSSSKMQYLGGLHKDEKFNAVHHYFLARDCTVQLVDLQLDLDEHIDVKLLSVVGFITEAKRGNVTDTPGVFLGYDQLKLIQEEIHA